MFVLLGHTLSVQFESHTDIENGRSFAQLDAMDYYEAPKPLIYLAENIVVNDPVGTHYCRLKEQQNQCLLNILNFRRDYSNTRRTSAKVSVAIVHKDSFEPQ